MVDIGKPHPEYPVATRAVASLFDARTIASRWTAEYCAHAPAGDVLCDAPDRAAWLAALEELAATTGESLDHARERAQRQAEDIGLGHRMPGESEERAWPLSPVPLLIGSEEWQTIVAGIAERAELIEAVTADLYGPGRLVSEGAIPAALVTGSPLFLRPMVGVTPPGGHHLHFFAADLCRDGDGRWRVLADHLRAPVGAGYALENRLAIARTIGGLQGRLNVRRHAPFFAAMRDGLAASCRRAEPRIGLLTPGRLNPSYAEQAHLARYLGFLLVEGADLAVRNDQLYVRTIAGLKRIDALCRRVDPRLLDPLAFDASSTIGVPGLIDAMAAGNVVIANAPGAGMLEAPAFAAFLPALAERLNGAPLKLPNIATWWCGQEAEREQVLANLDQMAVAPAFGPVPLGLPQEGAVLGSQLDAEARRLLVQDMARRPQDYVGQEAVQLSTMPFAEGERLEARPFTLRVFAARDATGQWAVLPGGFARIGGEADTRATVVGEGSWSADVCVYGPDPVLPISLLPVADATELRRNPGTLPSRVADNLFWLGRYLERGEALLGAIRVLLGHSISADTGAALADPTVARLVALIAQAGAAPAPAGRRRRELVEFARAAIEGTDGQWHNVRRINQLAAGIGAVSRDRLSADMMRLLDAPHPTRGGLLDRAGSLQRRYAALAGLSAEHMARTDAWRFHDLGRRLERALGITRAVATFVTPEATADDLSTLLDIADSQISYRQRYLTGFARLPVVDLVALDPCNTRAIAFQIGAIGEHLTRLPVLSDSGLSEPQQALAVEVQAMVATATAASFDTAAVEALEGKLMQLSNAIATRYFLQGAEPLRGQGLTLA
jgi:uncharacterized circularly permuted ATP-grasp superfamily protein/uncharacterized alpha-E superfamily protein